jgi:hypothetical protein
MAKSDHPPGSCWTVATGTGCFALTAGTLPELHVTESRSPTAWCAGTAQKGWGLPQPVHSVTGWRSLPDDTFAPYLRLHDAQCPDIDQAFVEHGAWCVGGARVCLESHGRQIADVDALQRLLLRLGISLGGYLVSGNVEAYPTCRARKRLCQPEIMVKTMQDVGSKRLPASEDAGDNGNLRRCKVKATGL